ncbi:unnamed protein product [Withania somnifera]
MAVHKEVTFLGYLLVLGIFLLVSTVEHADAKACTKECGHLGFGICPRSEGSPENPICINCCSGFKGPHSEGKAIIYPIGCTTRCTGYKSCYYSDQGDKFVCEGESTEPKALYIEM